MKERIITEGVSWVGAVDWDRRLFDALIPLPDGTSYNAYLVEGSEKTALLDTVDPDFTDVLLDRIAHVPRIDYIVSHHTEQDHSGAIARVLELHPEATVIASMKAKGMLMEHLGLPAERLRTVDDGETVSLGDLTLKFIYTPWVHWPETMCTYVAERKLLFSCDFFGSHLATTDLFAVDESRVHGAAKRYFAEIMYPFRPAIAKNLKKLAAYDIECIAPSHGPVYKRPEFILDAYSDWVNSPPRNKVVLPFVSMHGSTRAMVDHFVCALVDRGVEVERFDCADIDLGKLAMALVDAGTIVIGSPTVLGGPHPNIVYAAYLANALRPKARFAAVLGSYGWGGRMVDSLKELLSNLKVELLPPVMCKGYPGGEDLEALDALAEAIANKHREQGWVGSS